MFKMDYKKKKILSKIKNNEEKNRKDNETSEQ
jgi:hypothetical protein